MDGHPIKSLVIWLDQIAVDTEALEPAWRIYGRAERTQGPHRGR